MENDLTFLFRGLCNYGFIKWVKLFSVICNLIPYLDIHMCDLCGIYMWPWVLEEGKYLVYKNTCAENDLIIYFEIA